MANWAWVENGEIKETHDELPRNWRHISGLYLSANDTEFLATLGWLPVIKQHQTYDTAQKIVTGFDHVLVDGQVIETLKLKDNPAPLGLVFFLTEFNMQYLRDERDKRLRQSDWTQLLDVQDILPDDTKRRYRIYRQALRDLPELAQTASTPDGEIPWPSL